jgi:hypothetical protein
MLIDRSSYVSDDDIYPLVCGEIKDDSRLPTSMHCMMASHGDASGSRVNEGHDRRTASGQDITQAQIRHARRVYTGEIPLGLNPREDEMVALRFIINEQKPSLIAKSGC